MILPGLLVIITIPYWTQGMLPVKDGGSCTEVSKHQLESTTVLQVKISGNLKPEADKMGLHIETPEEGTVIVTSREKKSDPNLQLALRFGEICSADRLNKILENTKNMHQETVRGAAGCSRSMRAETTATFKRASNGNHHRCERVHTQCSGDPQICHLMERTTITTLESMSSIDSMSLLGSDDQGSDHGGSDHEGGDHAAYQLSTMTTKVTVIKHE